MGFTGWLLVKTRAATLMVLLPNGGSTPSSSLPPLPQSPACWPSCFQQDTTPGIEVSLPTPTPTPELKVYVSGAVAQPGVYSFREGDRLQEAVHSAGGLLPDADATTVNMAALLEDEQHYHLPLAGESKDSATRNTPPPLPQVRTRPCQLQENYIAHPRRSDPLP